MATAKYTEYLEVDGVPLDTPAWEVINQYGWLYNGAGVRTSDDTIPGRFGQLAGPVVRGPKRGPLVLLVNGDVDSDGSASSSLPAGLVANLDELKKAIQPPANSLTGSQTLRHVHPTEATRQGEGRLELVDLEYVSGNAARVTVDCVLHRGVMRGETLDNTTSASLASQTNVTVSNPGTGPQDESTIVLSGTATSVLLENLTWQADGNCSLTVAVNLGSGDVTIDTAAWSATQGGSDVHGSVTAGLHVVRSWLPLMPGDNTVRVTPTGGTVTVDWDHYPVYL